MFKNSDLLRVEPNIIDFGCLKPGEQKTKILKVSGGSGKVIVNNPQIKVSPSSFNNENNELQIKLVSEAAGELIWDDIVLHGENNQIKVVVIAHWEEDPFKIISEPPVKETKDGNKEFMTNRSFRGQVCSHCGKNFSYDIASKSWEQCKCPWYKRIWYIISGKNR